MIPGRKRRKKVESQQRSQLATQNAHNAYIETEKSDDEDHDMGGADHDHYNAVRREVLYELEATPAGRTQGVARAM